MRRIAKTGHCLLKNFRRNNFFKSTLIYTSLVKESPCLQLEWKTQKENIFNQQTYSQQKRDYSPNITINSEQCWNCKQNYKGKQFLMQCEHCGVLQDVKANINYFELLDFPQQFDLQAQVLTKQFRKLQTVVHPDKFSNKSSREQSNSADWSSLINKAYKTLLIPLERGKYLLELKGLQMPEDNSALDKEFLMEMMERNEEVSDAKTTNELNVINQRLEEELKEKVESLAKYFVENNLEKAKTILIEMKYLVSIQKATKNKLQILLAG